MLLQTQMHCGWFVRFVIYVCLVGFAAAKCVPEKCGSMNVSYPFWINNSDCGYPGFQISCTMDGDTGKMAPFFRAYLGNFTQKLLPAHDYMIMEIDYEGHLFIDSSSIKTYSCEANRSASSFFQPPNGGPFTISMSNKFLVIGCNTVGTYTYKDWGEARCVSTCEYQTDPPFCQYGCCEITLPDNWKWLNFTGGGLFKLFNSTTNAFDWKCGFSTILDPSTFRVVDDKTNLFWGEGVNAYYGLRLNWGIGLQNCSTTRPTANYSCSVNAECIDSPSWEGHVCKCHPGYEGNGYTNGTDCTDIDECSDKKLNMCVGVEEGGICLNLAGSYNCSCAKGYEGNGYSNGTDCRDIIECSDKKLNMCIGEEGGGICHDLLGSYSCSCAMGYKGDGFQNGTGCVSKSSISVKSVIIGSVSSFVGFFVVASGIFWCLSMRRLKRARDKNFLQNGGMQLQESIASMGGRKSLRIFSERELEIASNNYSTELGKGGFATVYKGILADSTPVAIKKPKSISDEFINEVIILSHINHRNVVKLIGCCMETQFPLLVYEYVPNGTVFEHLHSAENQLTWETRRQIATEIAEAIAYVHHQASQPIFHRDIKSLNILLDNTFTPKVADFGISRLRPSDERHLSTMLPSGTPGYVDPEFVKSNQFTDKSDVFSFGVVLVELLTGLMPLLSIEGSMCSLYDHFLYVINENRLTEILDPKVVNEENQGQMENVARLAKSCLQMKARARPSMREVVEELAWIRASTRQSSLYSDVSLVDQRGDRKQARQNYYALPTCDNSSKNLDEDYYCSSPPITTISSEGPPTALIQTEMSDSYAR
ncbi:hypothetical protein SUGI_0460050 [Cryptomeria japonica]|uniref:wall-associated receptor kinase 17 n=1 Tax=Cryptomeria japonica TaxID=3369 RepID=UPI002408EF9C|nr:wall-associated receptor kinase 17 [Cryptomeria japonica]GLJ24122.1 hypothetical protein SUGI_0460050 [Cryptomeria japonica]